jgi:hypothetical protein
MAEQKNARSRVNSYARTTLFVYCYMGSYLSSSTTTSEENPVYPQLTANRKFIRVYPHQEYISTSAIGCIRVDSVPDVRQAEEKKYVITLEHHYLVEVQHQTYRSNGTVRQEEARTSVISFSPMPKSKVDAFVEELVNK